MTEKRTCPVCHTEAECHCYYDPVSSFWSCPVCGRYEITESDMMSGHSIIKDSRLASYLFYHQFLSNDATELRFHTTLSKEQCDEFKKELENGIIKHGHPVHMGIDIVGNWYPKSLSERIDYILLKLYERTKHIGQSISFSEAELYSLLFVDHIESSKDAGDSVFRDVRECEAEALYMLEYLKGSKLVQSTSSSKYISNTEEITIAPEGYARIDELQRQASAGNNALVAMKFGDETKPLREAIRLGIQTCGYNAIFIDEVQHNDYITPELLKYIKNSKFVVVDLTHKNNGAYFEEGYAMGLGKPVIQLCKKGTDLHFDIQQKNTIMWASESDIPERLSNRIKATID